MSEPLLLKLDLNILDDVKEANGDAYLMVDPETKENKYMIVRDRNDELVDDQAKEGKSEDTAVEFKDDKIVLSYDAAGAIVFVIFFIIFLLICFMAAMYYDNQQDRNDRLISAPISYSYRYVLDDSSPKIPGIFKYIKSDNSTE